MADTFATYRAGLDAPAINAMAVTPSDGADMTYAARGITVNVAGTLSYVPLGADGDATATIAVLAGVMYPIGTARIRSTGTTATGIVAHW